jgi:hypothetical protein
VNGYSQPIRLDQFSDRRDKTMYAKLFGTLAVLLVVSSLSADDKKPDPIDAKKLVGKWEAKGLGDGESIVVEFKSGGKVMPPLTLVLSEMSREPMSGPKARLTLKPGVNVLVGVPNTGKTKWLVMLDYLLGDDLTQKDIEEKFEELFAKYSSAKIKGTIGGEEFTVERRWKEKGMLTKALLNGNHA